MSRNQLNCRVALTYQRPSEDQFHGGSHYFGSFARLFSSYVKLTTLTPPCTVGRDSTSTRGQFESLRFLIASYWGQFKFIAKELTQERSRRVNCAMAFDLYSGLGLLIWGRIDSKVTVYYAADLNVDLFNTGEKHVTPGPLLRLARTFLEPLTLRLSDYVWVVSDRMHDILVEGGTHPDQIRVCPIKNTCLEPDIDSIERWTLSLGLTDRKAAVFVGNCEYPPNAEAARYIIRDLAPALERTNPDVRLVLAGRGSDSIVSSAPPNVDALGRVEDLDNLLFACHFGIAPVLVRGGTSSKVVDYLTHGLPVLSSPEAAAGIVSNGALWIASRQDFANRVSELARTITMTSRAYKNRVEDRVYRTYVSTDDMAALASELDAVCSGAGFKR